jgi:hypothetical protein
VKESRAEAIKIASDLIERARNRVVDDITVPEDVANSIEDGVLVTAWGRAAVPRSGYGRREIEGVAIIEEPPRLIRQTHGLARGLYALGLDDLKVEQLCRRVALDSMPITRRVVLEALAAGGPMSTYKIAEVTGLHWHVANRTVEDLTVVGIADDLGGEDDRNHQWVLHGEEGDLVRAVIAGHLNYRTKSR